MIGWVVSYAFIVPTTLFAALGTGSSDSAAVSIAVIVIFTVGLVAIFGITIGLSYWWYRNYTYELTDTVFKKEYGILTKRNTGIPYERIQNVDIVAPLLYRIFGIAQLNIQTAGGSSYLSVSEGRLPGVSKQTAIELQAELLKRARSTNAHAGHQPAATPDGL